MPTESPEQLKKIAADWEDSFNGHAVELKKKRLMDLIESPEWMEVQKAYKEDSDKYAADNDTWWNKLSEEEKILAKEAGLSTVKVLWGFLSGLCEKHNIQA